MKRHRPSESDDTEPMLLRLLPEILRHVIKFLTVNSCCDHIELWYDNEIYQILRRVSRRFHISQAWFGFNLNLFKRDVAGCSLLHALCLREVPKLNPHTLCSQAVIANKHMHSYANPVTVKTEKVPFGLCCWGQLKEMTNLRNLVLLNLLTDNFSFLKQVTQATFQIQGFHYPLQLPPNLRKLKLVLCAMADSYLGQLRVICPPKVKELTLCIKDTAELAELRLNSALEVLVFKDLVNIVDIRGCDNLHTLRFVDCFLSDLPSLVHLTALRTLQLPYPWVTDDSEDSSDEETPTIGPLIKAVGPLPWIENLILPLVPLNHGILSGWTQLKNLTILSFCEKDEIPVIENIKKFPSIQTINYNNHTYQKV